MLILSDTEMRFPNQKEGKEMLVRWKPLTEMMSLFDTPMVSLFDNTWRPLVDVREDKENFFIDAEIPGVKQDDIKLTVKDNRLTIQGERQTEKKEGTDYYRTERFYGSFTRSFTLPTSADPDKIEASFEDGLLTVKIAKKAEEVPKQIEIKIKGPKRRTLSK